MNCKPGDLAYIVKPTIGHPDILGRIVEVKGSALPLADWIIEFVGAAPRSFIVPIHFCADDCALRPISGVPVDDETPIETNIPEALQLALGIQARVWA